MDNNNDTGQVHIPTITEIDEISKLMWKVIFREKTADKIKLDIFTLQFSSLRSIDNIQCRGFMRAHFNHLDGETISFDYCFTSFVVNIVNGHNNDEEEEEDETATYIYLLKNETFECNYVNVLAYLRNVFTHEIPSLKYNALTSTFEDKETFELNNSLGKIMGQIPNISVHKEVCCVCLEGTKFMTDCKHSICPPCLDRIIYTGHDHGETRCPMCRKNVADGKLLYRK